MKIIITALSPDIESFVDPHFGRGETFLIVDPETLKWQAITNPAVSASGRAGIQAVQIALKHKAEAIISGGFGVNAYNEINSASVPMYLLGSCNTVREVIEHFNAGQLERIKAPNKSSPYARKCKLLT